MKYIILGIKDYCKDCWHDYIECKWAKLHRTELSRNVNRWWKWKEGNIWHYIRQRKFANNKIQAK